MHEALNSSCRPLALNVQKSRLCVGIMSHSALSLSYSMWYGDEQIQAMVQRLDSLELFNKDIDCSRHEAQRYMEFVTRFLTHAKQLKVLRAHRFLTVNPFTGVQLPNLTTLELYKIWFVANELIDLVRVHKDNLRKLLLDTIDLHGDGNFNDVGNIMGQFLRLGHICVVDLDSDDRWTSNPRMVGMAFFKNVMQWVPKGKLLLEHHHDGSFVGKPVGDLEDPSGDMPQDTPSSARIASGHDGSDALDYWETILKHGMSHRDWV